MTDAETISDFERQFRADHAALRHYRTTLQIIANTPCSCEGCKEAAKFARAALAPANGGGK